MLAGHLWLMAELRFVSGLIGIAALAGFIWMAVQVTHYPAPWSAPWRETRTQWRSAATNAGIRGVALTGIAITLVWSLGASGGADSVAAGYGLGWFPKTAPPRSIAFPTLPWLWFALPVGLCVAFLMARRLLNRRTLGAESSTETSPAGDKSSREWVAEQSVAGLMSEADPRRVVLLSYLLMEGYLARRGWPRSRQETALEYVHRLTALTSVPMDAIRTLTWLFQLAAFSKETIDETMRVKAISALQEVAPV